MVQFRPIEEEAIYPEISKYYYIFFNHASDFCNRTKKRRTAVIGTLKSIYASKNEM